MKRINLVGLAIVAALALGACAANSASALPEIGRCVAKAGGNYTDSNCTTKATPKGTGGFEFLKGAAKPKFTVLGGASSLEGASGAGMECKTFAATGELKPTGTGATKGVKNVAMTFTGCTLPAIGQSCQNVGNPAGVIDTKVLEGNLGYITKKPLVVGVELHPKVVKKVSGAFAEWECGAGAVKIVTQSATTNCVISSIGPVNTMGSTSIQVYKSLGGGVQELTFFEKTLTKKCQLENSINGGANELFAWNLETTVTYEEPLEIKA
jgi:hypothetical protein